MRKTFAVLTLLFACLAATAQDSTTVLRLRFLPVSGNKKVVLGKGFAFRGDSISISTFRFYISNISLQRRGKKVWQEHNSHHLADIQNDTAISLVVPASIIFDGLVFDLGIDSLTNVAGAGSGDLDATKGMYWAWHSGYINFKLEGKSVKRNIERGNFAFHLGGFRSGEYCIQHISLPMKNKETIQSENPNSQTSSPQSSLTSSRPPSPHLGEGLRVREFRVAVDINTFFTIIDKDHPSLMTPGPETIRLSAIAAQMFKPMKQ